MITTWVLARDVLDLIVGGALAIVALLFVAARAPAAPHRRGHSFFGDDGD